MKVSGATSPARPAATGKPIASPEQTYPNLVAEAPAPAMNQQLDPQLGISVLQLRDSQTGSTTSIPSHKQLAAYAAQTTAAPQDKLKLPLA